MKRWLKITLLIIGILLIGVATLLTYVKTAMPNVGEPRVMTVPNTPETVARGAYLANHVMVCIDCHSTRDWSLFSGPPVAGTEGMGGQVFDQQMGFPGRYVAPNLTPAVLADWSDGEIFRAITTGVSRDGRPLFPVMPHPNYGKLDERDIMAVIAYIRSLKPIPNQVAASASDFPMNFILHTIPQKANLQPRPDTSDLVAYGQYMVTASSCGDCHTKQEKGEIVGEPFAGGMEFKFPDGSIAQSLNITPHSTGIGNWSEEAFLDRFRAYADSGYVPPKVGAGAFQTVMPWTMYAGMKERDLKAIYAYLKTLKPVESVVERFTPATVTAAK